MTDTNHGLLNTDGPVHSTLVVEGVTITPISRTTITQSLRDGNLHDLCTFRTTRDGSAASNFTTNIPAQDPGTVNLYAPQVRPTSDPNVFILSAKVTTSFNAGYKVEITDSVSGKKGSVNINPGGLNVPYSHLSSNDADFGVYVADSTVPGR